MSDPNWTTITEADLHAAAPAVQVNSAKTVLLAEGQSDPVAATIDDVLHYVRGKILAGGSSLAEGLLIPFSLRNAAVDLSIARLFARVPPLARLTTWKDRAKAAEDLLDAVAKGEFGIPAPREADADETPQPARPQAVTPSSSGPWSRSNQQGF